MFIIIKITNVMRCVLCFYLRYWFDSICLSFCCSYRIIKEICTFINACRPLCCCTSIRFVITCVACIRFIWCFFIILSLYCVIFYSYSTHSSFHIICACIKWIPCSSLEYKVITILDVIPCLVSLLTFCFLVIWYCLYIVEHRIVTAYKCFPAILVLVRTIRTYITKCNILEIHIVVWM